MKQLTAVPPHMIFGFTMAELAELGTILVILFGTMTWLISKAVVEPNARKQ